MHDEVPGVHGIDGVPGVHEYMVVHMEYLELMVLDLAEGIESVITSNCSGMLLQRWRPRQ